MRGCVGGDPSTGLILSGQSLSIVDIAPTPALLQWGRRSGVPSMPRPVRVSTAERRERVFRLLASGTTHKAIARHLRVSRTSVVGDVQAIRGDIRDRLRRDPGAAERIGFLLAKLEFGLEDSWRNYDSADSDDARAVALRVVLLAAQQRVEFLLDVGLVPRSLGRPAAVTVRVQRGHASP